MRTLVGAAEPEQPWVQMYPMTRISVCSGAGGMPVRLGWNNNAGAVPAFVSAPWPNTAGANPITFTTTRFVFNG